jgi:hypothetical protein
MKNTEILSFEDEWMNLKNITLSEFTQLQIAKGTGLFHVWFIGPVQMLEILYL